MKYNSELNSELNAELNSELNADLNSELNSELNPELNTKLNSELKLNIIGTENRGTENSENSLGAEPWNRKANHISS